MKIKSIFISLILFIIMQGCGYWPWHKSEEVSTVPQEEEVDYVDYVNPYMGNISHLLTPAYPTIHLPNSMLRVHPERDDYASEQIVGLPVAITNYGGSSAFNISPVSGTPANLPNVVKYTYDNEKITPYRYSVFLDEDNIEVDFAPSHRSGIYTFTFEKESSNTLIINTKNGKLEKTPTGISGYQWIEGGPARIYLYLETEQPFISAEKRTLLTANKDTNEFFLMTFPSKQINLRYGISFIDAQQAETNLLREINTYNVEDIAEKGRDEWNEALGKIEIEDDCKNAKTVFYTSLYRVYERMVNISEDGRYYSAADGKVHNDNGMPFYTDDEIWSAYRAAHPLRVLIDSEREVNMIQSYIRMAQQSSDGWMPTSPEITGDSRRMNANHAVAAIWDAYCKGLRGFDLEAAYAACKKALTEKSLLPGTKTPNTALDVFYHEKGYFPALKEGEKEYVKEVDSNEKRQSVAVSLGTCYDEWCLSQIAKELGHLEDHALFLNGSYNYRNLYNPETGFFHPKDMRGAFIQPFDYRFSGGQGARDYYVENNAYTYRWDVPHNPADLIQLMGSPEKFVENLNQTFREPLGKSKFEFYAQLPDQTGNVGQFSMASEPSFHIPYLYNYAGQPWQTQKLIRKLMNEWYRNDAMGIPGDEGGGGMSAFVVFSSMGFYPVTPGSPTYNIGSPMFNHIKINLSNGNVFEIEALNCSNENKYIQSATLNGESWDKPWFSQENIDKGGKLTLVMGPRANKQWGSALENRPPSAEAMPSAETASIP
ncbi:MAG: GH92 family glycosyl hydrolase [Candidatus Azobacteroides sp.]|nr:GH92 family glycosyl hydrolase [Candidatus Azobacteroides sp.]